MLKRLWVIGLVTLTALLSTALPARAATSDMAAANRAGAWLSAQLTAGHLPGADAGSEFGNTAIGLIGLAATDDPSLKPGIDAMRAYLVEQGPTQGASSSRAAVLAIAADALGLAPTAFGVDPIEQITKDTAADGAVGAYPNAYSQGFALVGLARAGGAPTDAQVSWLVGQQDASGAFGYADWTTGAFVADPDSTALAVLGLSVSGRADARAAAASAAAWLVAHQQADGSWAAWSPVNTTALVGMALGARGVDTSKALAWVTSQQAPSGALLFGADPDAYATSQALVFLGGATYRTVSWEPRTVSTPAPTATVTVTATSSPRPAVTVTGSAATTPGPTVTVTSNTTNTVTRTVAAAPPAAATPAAATTADPTPSASTTPTPAAPAEVAPGPGASETATPVASVAPRPLAVAEAAPNADTPLFVGGAAMLALATGGGFWLLRKR